MIKLAALLGLGLRGIQKKLHIKIPPIDASVSADLDGERLPKTLAVANEKFMAKTSVAREVLGDDFVHHFGGTRQHELRQFEEAVTDWELERYLELA
jgi:glutamine synthetase